MYGKPMMPGAAGGLPPQVDMQRNSIADALMNIRNPPGGLPGGGLPMPGSPGGAMPGTGGAPPMGGGAPPVGGGGGALPWSKGNPLAQMGGQPGNPFMPQGAPQGMPQDPGVQQLTPPPMMNGRY